LQIHLHLTEDGVFFAKNDKLYPIFNFFTGFERPLFKVFLVYKDFAVGVTRPITKIIINEFTEIDFEEDLIKGMFYFEGERVLIVDFEKTPQKSDASFSPLILEEPESRKKTKSEKIVNRQTFVILEGTDFALKFEDIEEIVEVEKLCPISFERYTGFVSRKSGEILNVESLVENGKWILITKDRRAFRTARILITNEEKIISPENDEEYLIFEGKSYKILR
jgi:hypothetical protein